MTKYWVQTKEQRDNRRHLWSGAPDCPVHTGQCSVHHRTVSGAPEDSNSNLPPSGISRGTPLKFTGLSGVHRTVSGAPRKSRLRNSPASGKRSGCSAIIHRTVRCTPDSVRCSKEERPQELASLGKTQRLLRYNSPDMSGMHRTVR
jgi:hypothetical protein